MRISSLQWSNQYLQMFWNVPVAMASKIVMLMLEMSRFHMLLDVVGKFNLY